jgi:hypothetical protein
MSEEMYEEMLKYEASNRAYHILIEEDMLDVTQREKLIKKLLGDLNCLDCDHCIYLNTYDNHLCTCQDSSAKFVNNNFICNKFKVKED